MALATYNVFLVTLLTFSVFSVSSERMKNKIYDSIDGAAACFRRLNGTHQFGCSSSRLGNVGIVHLIEDIENVTWLCEYGEAVPYMVVLRPHMFTRDVLERLKNSGKVNGIVLLNNESSAHIDSFSHEDTCPNRYSGLSSFSNQTCDDRNPWNPQGTKLLLMDWGFPFFYVSSETGVKKLLKCYNDFNSGGKNQQHDHSLCALEMNSFMYAAVNSAVCIRRSSMITNFNPVKFCDPLGDRSIWCTLFPRNKSQEDANRSVIVVSARLDTASMFDGVTPGAVSPTTGIVALLATAEALFKMLPDNSNYSKNVMFILLNGESYDYIGSSRLVWDMSRGAFPNPLDPAVVDQPPLLKAEHLGLFVELSHLSNHFNSSLVFHHALSINKINVWNEVSSFVNEMKNVGKNFSLTFSEKYDGKLPPASLQTFLMHDKDLPGLVIADFKDNFTTNYYHSVFDDGISLKYVYQNGSEPSRDSIQAFVSNFATTLAYSLFTMVTNKSYQGNVSADINTVDQLFHCYLDKTNCSLFRAATYKQPLLDRPANMYVGVNTWSAQNQITMLTGQTLAYLTGNSVNFTEEQCRNNAQHQIFQYLWVNGAETKNERGKCIKTTMNYTIASSPAFEISGYNWTSGQYSTWTESIWQELHVRIFLKPSRYHEDVIFSAGAVVLILSFIIIYFLNARSHILFGNTLGTGAC